MATRKVKRKKKSDLTPAKIKVFGRKKDSEEKEFKEPAIQEAATMLKEREEERIKRSKFTAPTVSLATDSVLGEFGQEGDLELEEGFKLEEGEKEDIKRVPLSEGRKRKVKRKKKK